MYKNKCMINSMMLHSFEDNAKISQLTEVLKMCYLMNFCRSCFSTIRSSHPQVFYRKGVLRPVTLLKKSLQHRWFPVNFTKFLRHFFFTEHLRWLLLKHGFIQICFGLFEFSLFLFYEQQVLQHYHEILKDMSFLCKHIF